jgi:hypothetical protein
LDWWSSWRVFQLNLWLQKDPSALFWAPETRMNGLKITNVRSRRRRQRFCCPLYWSILILAVRPSFKSMRPEHKVLDMPYYRKPTTIGSLSTPTPGGEPLQNHASPS